MAKYMNASVAIMRNIKKINDLQLFLYKMRKRQYLTHAEKHKRLGRANSLLGELKVGLAEREIVVFFSDEKPITIETTDNNQNDRIYAKSSTKICDSVRKVKH